MSESEGAINKSSDERNRGDIAVFFLAMSWFIEVQLVGRLFVVEVIFCFIAFAAVVTDFKGKITSTPVRTTLVLLLLWLLAQIGSDLYQNTSFADYARGWSKILFFGTNIVALSILLKNNERRILLFAVGYSIGEILGLMWFPNIGFAGGSIWKFGYGVPITTLCVLGCLVFNKKMLWVSVLLVLAIINLFLDYRSLAGCCFGAAVLTVFAGATEGHARIRNAAGNVPLTGTKKFLRATAAVAIMIFFVYFYQNYISGATGLGIDVGQRDWDPNDPAMENVLYGRIEFFIGLNAAMDSPIIGHGSWAKDYRYADVAEAMTEEAGWKGGYDYGAQEGLIPSHSYIVGGWVEAGIVGAIFWLFVFIRSVKALAGVIHLRARSVPIISFFLLAFLWAIIFSPFGAQARITGAFSIVLVSFVGNSLKAPKR
jgi:hypothetical protein